MPTLMTHELKTWPDYFDAVWRGDKPYELRKDDGRNFKVGDRVRLMEYHPGTSHYTRRRIHATIGYITAAPTPWGGLEEGWVILGLNNIEPYEVI